jgi:hypothetical protein
VPISPKPPHSGASSLDGPTAATRTLSATRVTTATESSSSKTISLPSRQLRNLSATYGAAYTCYAKTASSGNLTGVKADGGHEDFIRDAGYHGDGVVKFEDDRAYVA